MFMLAQRKLYKCKYQAIQGKGGSKMTKKTYYLFLKTLFSFNYRVSLY